MPPTPLTQPPPTTPPPPQPPPATDTPNTRAHKAHALADRDARALMKWHVWWRWWLIWRAVVVRERTVGAALAARTASRASHSAAAADAATTAAALAASPPAASACDDDGACPSDDTSAVAPRPSLSTACRDSAHAVRGAVHNNTHNHSLTQSTTNAHLQCVSSYPSASEAFATRTRSDFLINSAKIGLLFPESIGVDDDAWMCGRVCAAVATTSLQRVRCGVWRR